MDTGLAFFPTGDAIGPGALAALIEDRGHISLWFPEHTHIPAIRETPNPSGGELPRRYAHCLDLFVAMTAAAAATKRLRIGSGICLVIERDPIVTAKEVASVDHLSGGRVEFGVGAGWNREEMRNHGTDPKRRFSVMRERVEAMKEIWTQEEASYHGEHVDFDRIWSWPKPTQQPHPPVLIGGNGDKVLDRVLRYGDAWAPQHRHGNAAQRIPELQRRAEEAGRGHIPVYICGVPADAKVLAEYEAAGADRVVRWLPSAPQGPVERELERYEDAIRELRGE